MNRFLYAEGNPWTLIDPSGHMIGCASASSDLCNEAMAVKYKNAPAGKKAAKTVSAHDHAYVSHTTAGLSTPLSTTGGCPGPTCGSAPSVTTETDDGTDQEPQGVLVDSTGFRYSSTNGLPPICIGADDVRKCAQIRSGGTEPNWTMVVVAGVAVFVLVAGCLVLCPAEAGVGVAYGTGAATVGAGSAVWAAEEEAGAGGTSGMAEAAAGQGAGAGGSAGLEAEIRALPAGNSPGVVTVSTPGELQAIYDRYASGGTPIANSYPEGTMRQLEDGTTIGIRDSLKYGRTIDVVLSSGERVKIHVQP